jgi:coenzyme Q-binding protein COQ10
MPYFECKKALNYTPEEIFDLIVDIESYPEFLPWCIDAKITDRSSQVLLADLTIKFNIVTQRYRSIVTTEQDKDNYVINIQSKHSVFEYLNSKWTVSKNNFGSDVGFFIDFKFKSYFFEELITLIFEKIASKIISKFEARAKKIYSK